MLTKKVEELFNNYLSAFKAYDLTQMINCYFLPCTLNTPDKIILVTNENEFQQAFNDIFDQLKQANTSKMSAQSASYRQLTDSLLLVCIDWDFYDGEGQVFADFSAFYHVAIITEQITKKATEQITEQTAEKNTEQKLKIVNVVSHELSNSLPLTIPFTLLAHKN
ncbi:MAG: hypothetical protein OCD00_12920 [Colwellia sp.]